LYSLSLFLISVLSLIISASLSSKHHQHHHNQHSNATTITPSNKKTNQNLTADFHWFFCGSKYTTSEGRAGCGESNFWDCGSAGLYDFESLLCALVTS
jgi:hypothetical protein